MAAVTAEASPPATSTALFDELASIGDLLGARCVDASQVESAVISRCDATLELQQRRAELVRAERHAEQLAIRLEVTRGSAVERLQEEVAAARARQDALQAKTQELAQRVREQQQALQLQSRAPAEPSGRLPAAAAAPSAPASASAPEPASASAPLRWGSLKSSSSQAPLVLDSDSDSGSEEFALAPKPDLERTAVAATGPALAPSDPRPQASSSANEVLRRNGATDTSQSSTPAPTMSSKEYLRQLQAASPSQIKREGALPEEQEKPPLVEASGPEPGASSKAPGRSGVSRTPRITTPAPTMSSKEYLRQLQVAPQGVKKEEVGAVKEEASPQKRRPPPDAKMGSEKLAAKSEPAPPGRPPGPELPTRNLPRGLKREHSPSSTPPSKREAKSEASPTKASLLKGETKQEPTSPDGPSKLPEDEDRTRVVVGKKTAPSSYRINAAELVPKSMQTDNRWKDANPAEWRAALAEGEVVSPHRNLMKVKPGTKRNKHSMETQQKAKVRRDDDTHENSFQRRQAMWTRAAVSSDALKPKQAVDQDGVPLKNEVNGVKSEPGSDAHVSQASASSSSLLLVEDVTVAEGLRCPRWLWEALYPYQHTCVKWLWGLHGERSGGILADEMGLGKTVQIAGYLAALHHSGVLQSMRVRNTSLGAATCESTGGVLVVCPATLIAQWRSELNLWYPPLRVCVMHQVDQKERQECIRVASSSQGVLVTSYETMRIALEDLLEASWVYLILDEGQKIRNPNASITIAAKRFSTPHRVILSGSPIQNNLQELWSLFDFICPGRLGTLPVFMQEFASPIELGNLVGANQARVAAAYECALALRELTMPCVLRRLKADNMDVLQLPHKQEQVLFCHLTPEQYQVYIDFLQTEQVSRAMNAGQDRKLCGAVFFAISVLRKLCNHPDLLLRNADPEVKPPDMWNVERSGKMKVLREIMKLWHTQKHRALIFVQTIQMLNVIEQWMNEMSYTYLRIDGQTAVKRRLKMINDFNADPTLFAMLLTTRVGGVGLNIIGADRVVIFDPDWNPMTDVQARERTWRIGQTRDVAVYRLVLTGTLEEKVYQRQVYKHFLQQKILSDPRQRQFFKWNDLADLFDIPPPPPNFDPKDMATLREKYKSLFSKFDNDREDDEDEGNVETTQVMKAIADLPSNDVNVPSKETSDEHSTILKTLYDAHGIKANFNHDKVEQPLLDRKIVRDGANMIAQRALAAIKKSAQERSNHHISEPTWTGQAGSAGAARPVKREGKVKREPGFVGDLGAKSGVNSADILDGLRQLASIRSMAKSREGTQNYVGGISARPRAADTMAANSTENPASGSAAPLALTNGVGLPTELLASDRKIAEKILAAFLDPKLAGKGRCLTTGQVLSHLAKDVAAHHSDLFKSLLKEMCELSKPKHPSEPGVWSLRREYWPKPK